LDSWAILSFLQKEKSSSIIEDIVHEAIENQTNLYIHSINMGEV